MSDGHVNVDDFEETARERLEPGSYDYIAGGAGDEHPLRANSDAFARWELRPRVLVDVGNVSTTARLPRRELRSGSSSTGRRRPHAAPRGSLRAGG